jgi:hypothetical protein
MDNICPHCRSSSCLSPRRNLLLGPSGSAACRVCGKNVRVQPLRSTLVILPLALYIVSLGTGWLKNLVAAMGIFVVLLPVCALLYIYWVPFDLKSGA